MATDSRNAALVRGTRPAWLVVPAVVAGAVGVLVVALLAGGGRPLPAAPGLPDPGALVGWGLPVARLAMDLAAVVTVGSLLFAVMAPSRGDALGTESGRAVRAASGCAWVWAVTAAASLVFTLADFLGVPVNQVDYQGTLATFVAEVAQGRALAVILLLTVILAATARNVRTLNGAGLLLVMAIATTVPPVLTGHSASAANHDVATSSLLVHVVAVTLWIGGLVGLLAYARSSGSAMHSTARRFSTMALWCFVAAAFSGLVNAWVRISDLGTLVTTPYGWLVLGKVTALVLLGGIGWWHRRATLPALHRGDRGAFRRFAVVEAAVMAATVGLAVALSRTPTPVPEEARRTSTAEALIGYPVPPFSGLRLLTEWRLDTLVVVVAAAAVLWYVRSALTLRRSGVRWPVGRTVAWIAGVAVAVVVLCGGVATYAPAMFSVHMVQHMTLTMLVPILLAMGAPVTLALRSLPAGSARRTSSATSTRVPAPGEPGSHARGSMESTRGVREWLLVLLHSRVASILTHPIVALGLYIVSLYAFYFSGLFVTAMSSHTGHLLMALHFLLVGALFFWSVIGLDPLPRRLPPLGRMLMLFASLPFHAFFGVIVMTSATLLAGGWYSALKLPWVDPLVDQNLGGGIAWATAELPSLLVLGVVFAQWVREDKREARRIDRRLDSGKDDQLAAYNAWLADLATKGRRRPEPR